MFIPEIYILCTCFGVIEDFRLFFISYNYKNPESPPKISI